MWKDRRSIFTAWEKYPNSFTHFDTYSSADMSSPFLTIAHPTTFSITAICGPRALRYAMHPIVVAKSWCSIHLVMTGCAEMQEDNEQWLACRREGLQRLLRLPPCHVTSFACALCMLCCVYDLYSRRKPGYTSSLAVASQLSTDPSQSFMPLQ